MVLAVAVPAEGSKVEHVLAAASVLYLSSANEGKLAPKP